MGHFPEPERVIAEFGRVLKPGGRVAISWWEGFGRNRINGIFHETIGRLAKSTPDVVPAGPPMDRFSDAERLTAFLWAAGFGDAKVTSVSFTHRVRDADALWDLAMGSFARASATIDAQDETVQRQIRTEVARAAQHYAGDDGLDIPVAFLIASGTK
jgi:SAM-dependent methyltransferase